MTDRSGALNEAQIILRLREIFASSDPRIEVGIGDDAAVVVGNNACHDDASNTRDEDRSTQDADALQSGIHTVCIVLRYRESGLYLIRLG